MTTTPPNSALGTQNAGSMTQEPLSQQDSLSRDIWQDAALTEALLSVSQQTKASAPSEPVVTTPVIHTTKPEKPSMLRYWAMAASVAAFALLVGSLTVYTSNEAGSEAAQQRIASNHSVSQTYETDSPTVVTLSDGTEVHLNAHSQLVYSSTTTSRHALLTRGEALFAVKRDETRPFTVTAAQTDITVLGTRFNVNKTQQSVWVDVFHGKVSVENQHTHQQQTLLKGDGVQVTAQSMNHHAVETEQPSWQLGWITCDNMLLSEAAYLFNRYSSKPVVLNGSIHSLKVSGKFNTRDVGGALRLISEVNNLTFTEYSDSFQLAATN
ncbi:hypothetical protein FJ444_03860 [Aestuariibacter sp. GS-14]|uniref:FecR family protein n=1 Tax=Aestuariibacter sp. GS-14 TaxID=2590670 RepID=UPI00112E23A6|nr:FecR domain-containing protein [Aestuariibacter sp. GS-14]TPV60769.1 hypothetical protein FJ444_03860 [Aestuariibacter sp. GS-14]